MRASLLVKLMSLAAVALVALAVEPASATMSTGGVFDKIDGSYFAKKSSRSRVGRRNTTKTYSVNKKRRAKKRVSKKYRTNYASSGGYKVGPRPRKWCGWWMRTQKGGGPKFNVAWNWRHYGSPTSARIGAVVIWRHHVGMIVGRTANGRWIVKSGNDSNRVRTRARSVKGAIFRI